MARVKQPPTGMAFAFCGPGRGATFVDVDGTVEHEEKLMDEADNYVSEDIRAEFEAMVERVGQSHPKDEVECILADAGVPGLLRRSGGD